MKHFILILLLLCTTNSQAIYWQDVSRINSINISQVFKVQSESDAIEAINYAKQQGKKVVIAGTKHSQGGHILFPDAVLLNMKSFNKVIDLNLKQKRIKVQSGISWAEIQQVINPHRLSVAVMQSSNIFSIGGSLSANIHGRDPRYGPLIETVISLKVLLASGDILIVSRQSHADIFHSVMGGFGVIAVILEAELQLIDDTMLAKSTTQVDYDAYIANLKENTSDLELHYGRCSFVKGKDFLQECYSVDYRQTDSDPANFSLVDEQNIERNAFFFNLSRHSDFGKILRWHFQRAWLDIPETTQIVSRNNAMRPPIKFLDFKNPKETDILQEYFIPLDQFASYMASLKMILTKQDVNLLSLTLRYVKHNSDSLLAYSKQDSIAIVLYININLEPAAIKHAKEWTIKLVDSAIEHQGSYYLVYQRFPTLEQFQTTYPRWQEFTQIKKRHDPDMLFNNLFYQTYLH